MGLKQRISVKRRRKLNGEAKAGVSIHASDEHADDIVDLMSRHNLLDVHDLAGAWRQAGQNVAGSTTARSGQTASRMEQSTSEAATQMNTDQARSQASTQHRSTQQ